MSNRLASKYKISRRLKVNLWGGEKDPVKKKNYYPGQHGPSLTRRSTDYSIQLRAKQKMRFYYDTSERQFKNIYKLADQNKGDTAENMIGLLESRVSILLYRANFVPSVFAARQLVSHKHVMVNGKKVNIPSLKLKTGDVITLTARGKGLAVLQESLQKLSRKVPEYLDVDFNNLSIKLVRSATLSEVPYEVQMEPNLIVEYYSR